MRAIGLAFSPTSLLWPVAIVTWLFVACSSTGQGSPSSTATPDDSPTAIPDFRDERPNATSTVVIPPEIALETHKNERYQGRYFNSAEEWQQKVDEWQARRPPSPGLIAIARATAVGAQTSEQVRQDSAIKNDKWIHCVLGAEIARATNQTAAEYAGWLKEQQDLTDGRSNSGFDELDFEATVDGARLVSSRQLPEIPAIEEGPPLTASLCEDRWGDRYSRWDGTFPPS